MADDLESPTADPAMNADELARLIDERVNAGVSAALASRAPAPASSAPPPATPPAGGGASGASSASDIAAAVDAAVSRALKERDDEDALTLLERQIAELKSLVGATPTREQRPRWAQILVGMR